MPTAAVVSFRLGGTDGVAVVAESWRRALETLDFEVLTVAGEGPVDRLLPGLAMTAPEPPAEQAVREALSDADLVVVENLCSIPLNLAAARLVAAELKGRPALLHHHDPPWQRAEFAHITELPPDDPAWRHVTINRLTEAEFATRGITTTTIYNGFDIDPPLGDRSATRRNLGVSDTQRLFIHPVRAIARKNVPAALRICEQLDATYWLLGPGELGYQDELERLLAAAICPVIHRPSPTSLADAYAASDVVLFPSTWEGFGNPPIEAALHRRPAVVGDYPVADELKQLGFDWFPSDAPAPLANFLEQPNEALLDRNQALAREHFSQDQVVQSLSSLFDEAGWLP